MASLRHRVGHAVLLMLVACSVGADAKLSPVEARIVADLRFDAELMTKVKDAGTALDRLVMEDGTGTPLNHAGLVLLTRPGESREALTAVRAMLEKTAYGAWINDDGFGRGPDKIAIMKTHDQFVYLGVAHTDGINWDLTHEDVVARYRVWVGKLGLELRGAGLDWLSARITKPPADWMALAREVYAFCPDIVDQGTGTVEKLADEMRITNELFLWWD